MLITLALVSSEVWHSISVVKYSLWNSQLWLGLDHIPFLPDICRTIVTVAIPSAGNFMISYFTGKDICMRKSSSIWKDPTWFPLKLWIFPSRDKVRVSLVFWLTSGAPSESRRVSSLGVPRTPKFVPGKGGSSLQCWENGQPLPGSPENPFEPLNTIRLVWEWLWMQQTNKIYFGAHEQLSHWPTIIGMSAKD